MGEIVVDLSSYMDRFVSGSSLKLNKKVNFVFGKNGTGKSTIAEHIKQQFSQSHDVRIFDGYEKIIGENESLDAIVLGTENTEIQKRIKLKDEEISLISKELDSNQEGENLIKRYKKAQDEYDAQELKINKFFTTSASIISNKKNPPISYKSYNKNNFKSEIEFAKLITDEEVIILQNIIKENKKNNVIKLIFPELESGQILKQVNNILQKSISIKKGISELDNNKDKQNFAREGLKVHKHEDGEKCAFCGREISEERWLLLEQYFNIEVGNLENDIDLLLGVIATEIQKINEIVPIDKNLFYEQFKIPVEYLNDQITAIKDGYRVFLSKLIATLDEKKKNLFVVSDELKIDSPKSLAVIYEDYKSIVDQNNSFSDNLKGEQESAENRLRYNEIKKTLEEFNYEAKNQKLQDLDEAKKKVEKEVMDKRIELGNKQEERKKLVEKAKDEGGLAKKISDCLKSTGLESFTLELVPSTITSERGQYRIKGHNGQRRSIKQLSKGEKNIIACLYFIFKLQDSENIINKNKIIVFDDPMTSNDDTMQYLMITEIKKLYGRLQSNDHFLLLTHNIHFYLNVRPTYNKKDDEGVKERNKRLREDNRKEKLYHEKHNYFKLQSNGRLSEIKQIISCDGDFKSNYHALRDDLVYLYSNNKPLSMINNCRRILETYINFNGCDFGGFYKDNEEAQKLFNVNSHGIEDLENEPNGKTCDEILHLLKGVLKTNNAEDHFKVYFPDES